MLCDISDIIADTPSNTKIHIVKISSKFETAGTAQFSDVSGKNHVPIDSAAAKVSYSCESNLRKVLQATQFVITDLPIQRTHLAPPTDIRLFSHT